MDYCVKCEERIRELEESNRLLSKELDLTNEILTETQKEEYGILKCSTSNQTHWYDEICVEVTIQDIIVAGNIPDAICDVVDTSISLKLFAYTKADSASQVCKRRMQYNEVVICTFNGIVTKWVKDKAEHSPCSIVKLICPTLEEACSNPGEFIMMFEDQNHQYDEGGDWLKIYNQFFSIYREVKKL